MILSLRRTALLGVHLALFLLSTLVGAQVTDHWESIILPGIQCRYLVPAADVDPGWTGIDFDDSNWVINIGGVGYGDDDDYTVIAPSISVYCRYDFTLSNPGIITDLVLDMDFDDGFVAYLNGVELARFNMGGTGTSTTWDQPSEGLQEALLYQGLEPMRFLLDETVTDLLVTGTNTFAIEVHNESITSSDLSSNAYLQAGVGSTGNYFHGTPSWFYPPYLEDSTLLPLVVIDTDGQSIPDEPKITALMKLVDNGAGNYNRPGDPGNGYTGQIGIEQRGESSLWLFLKKSYSFETRTDSGENNNVSLLGMPEENDWVLYGPYADKSLMRNVLSYRIFAEMGHYAPRTRFVDVVINNNYKGVYVLTEKIKRDKNRVDMAKLLPEDISGDELTGGYLMRIDKLTAVPETDYWVSPVIPPVAGYAQVTYQYFDPEYGELNDPQRAYIKDYLLEFESALIFGNFKDPEVGYRAYLDIPSFIDMMILNEFTKDVDGFRLSHYFYKQKDSDGGKLVTGPPWDYNLTFGNSDFSDDIHQTYNWVHTLPITIYWWARTMEDSWFRNQVRCRWDALYESVLSSDHLQGMIDSAIQVMGPSLENNFKRWPVLGVYVWPNYYVGQSYSDEEWYLRNWIEERLQWIDARWGGECWPLSSETNQVIPLPDSRRIYPNPSNLASTYVDLNGLNEPEISFRIVDMNGQVVHQATAYYSGSEFAYSLPDLSYLPNGVYMLETLSSNRERAVFKLIKQ
jgi:hypothetical protein